MKKNTVYAAVLFLFIFGSQALAYRPAVMGGARYGTALGLMLQSEPPYYPSVRLGFEANTSTAPGILFIGGKWPLTEPDSSYPAFFSGGIVGYLGNTAQPGVYVSMILERFLNVNSLFLEVGVDVVDAGRVQFQLGYYL
jgi:hypothetical protein